MNLDEAALAELERVGRERTQGIWLVEPSGIDGSFLRTDAPQVRKFAVIRTGPYDRDAIVAAVNAMEALVAEVRRLRDLDLEWQTFARERNHPFATPWPTWSAESLAVKAELEAKISALESKLAATQVRLANAPRHDALASQIEVPRRGYGYRMCCREGTCDEGAHDDEDMRERLGAHR